MIVHQLVKKVMDGIYLKEIVIIVKIVDGVLITMKKEILHSVHVNQQIVIIQIVDQLINVKKGGNINA
jgi:hypothetical protein